ncbi:hypothetical protein V8E54_012307 [Elaphomyces granulatus]
MASKTAAMGLGTGEAGQPEIRQMDRRESWCQEDVDALVNKAYESFEAANRTITALRIEISCLEHENQRLKDEVSQLEEQADDLIDERNRLQRTVVHLAASHTVSREASATPTEKSVKIPNPPVLTNGKDPEFEDWESRIRNKLEANADHYNTEVLRIAYVENRTGGKAAKHLRPRLRVNAVNPYITAEEMLKHLESIFQDPNREANSKREFRDDMEAAGNDDKGFYGQQHWLRRLRWYLYKTRGSPRGHQRISESGQAEEPIEYPYPRNQREYKSPYIAYRSKETRRNPDLQNGLSFQNNCRGINTRKTRAFSEWEMFLLRNPWAHS